MRKYPRKSRAAVIREAKRRARRPYRPPRSRGPVGEALQRNGSHRCDLKDCAYPRLGLGRYCRTHAFNYARTGHPVALSVGPREWLPFVLRAETFVCEQLSAGHPSIVAALRWIEQELRNAERSTTHDVAHLEYEQAILRAKRSGVDAIAFLARFVAGELADDRGREPGPRYASDTHAAHQRTTLYLYAMPLGRKGRDREPQPPRGYGSRNRWRVRDYTWKRLNPRLGLLAMKAAEEIRRRDLQQQR